MSALDFDSTHNRRHDQRVQARFDVRFSRVSDAARALNAFSLNFSAGGLCLRTSASYVVGDPLQLDLTICEERFSLSGVVAWSRNGAIGVRFTNVNPALRERLERVARTLAQNTSLAGVG